MSKEKILAMQKQVTGKLMAAISMLLVSAILMCLTSYAWFILSTAPEVSNLKTTAGANGALEIALQSTNEAGTGRADITSAVGSSHAVKSAAESNTYWGNVVDLTEGYGLEHVTLYPSRLNVTGTQIGDGMSYRVATNSILSAAKFGQDGRLVGLEAATKTHYNASGENAGQFTDTSNWGVNVIGFTKTGDTAQDNSYTRAYSRANVLAEATQKVATYRTELRADMAELIKDNQLGIFGMMFYFVNQVEDIFFVDEALTTATVKNFAASMSAMLGDASDAVRWALLANTAADASYSSDSEEDMKMLGAIYKGFLQYPLTADPDHPEITSVEGLATGKYPEIVEAAKAISTAQARIDRALREVDGAPAFAALMFINPQEAFMYGKNADKGVADQPLTDALAYDLLESGTTEDTIFVVKKTDDIIGENLFSSLATVLGDYSALMTPWMGWIGEKITVVNQIPAGANEDEWLSMSFGIKATNGSTAAEWRDVSNLDLADADANIGVLGAVYKEASSKTARGDILMPVTRADITAYGYSVDLAFQSSVSTGLILQREGIDRVSGSSGDVRLQGGGSTMTFTLAGDLTHEQAARLLQCVYIVFMDTGNGTVYKVAAADPASIETQLDTATAELQLYEPKFAADGSLSLGAPDDSILNMSKDTAYYVTAVVYLNGDLVDSGMFAPGEALSLEGTVNLQFASEKTLQPMDYTTYYTEPTQGTGKDENEGEG